MYVYIYIYIYIHIERQVDSRKPGVCKEAGRSQWYSVTQGSMPTFSSFSRTFE